MKQNKPISKKLIISILSLSLLTIMAGAAISPALAIIKEHFSAANPLLIQMLISTPALFIIITNFIFPHLCKYIRSRSLVLLGLLFYIVGGCLPILLDNIYLILMARALLGIGVGIIMPLSTGLLVYYFAPEELEKLMGYSSAMNQLGGIIATLASGLLAGLSWNASFLVYLMGLLCMILCLLFLPNDKIRNQASDSAADSATEAAPKLWTVFKQNYVLVVAIFLIMMVFFIYPSNFAIETSSDNIIPQNMIAVIMSLMNLCAFMAGLSFVRIKMALEEYTRLVSPTCFIIGYLLLSLVGGWIGTLLGSFIIGIANGAGIPYITSTASKRAGRNAGTTVLPLISASLYLAQFVTPLILSTISVICGPVKHLPYKAAIVFAIILWFWSFFKMKEQPKQETQN